MQYQGTQIPSVVAKILADKRDSKRVKSVFTASIHSDGQFYAHCVIKDVSSTGMKLKLQEKVELPFEFEVKTPVMAETARVRQAWAKGLEYGVEFIDFAEEANSESAA